MGMLFLQRPPVRLIFGQALLQIGHLLLRCVAQDGLILQTGTSLGMRPYCLDAVISGLAQLLL